MHKLTIGYRCRIKPSSTSWGSKGHGYENREVLLQERNDGEFSVMVLKRGKNVPLDKHWKTVTGVVAWVIPDDMELVDKDIDTNLDFMDWWEEHKEDFCPECDWFDEHQLAKWDYYDKCPNCGRVID